MKKLFKSVCVFLSIAFVAVSLSGCNSDKDTAKTKSFVSEQEYLDTAVSNRLNVKRLSVLDGTFKKDTTISDDYIQKSGIISSTSMYSYVTLDSGDRFKKVYEINYNVYEDSGKADTALDDLIWNAEKDAYKGKFSDEGYIYDNCLSGVVTDYSSNYDHHVCTVIKDSTSTYYDYTRIENKIIYLVVYDSSNKEVGFNLYSNMIK